VTNSLISGIEILCAQPRLNLMLDVVRAVCVVIAIASATRLRFVLAVASGLAIASLESRRWDTVSASSLLLAVIALTRLLLVMLGEWFSTR
jgi:hypothetical protein